MGEQVFNPYRAQRTWDKAKTRFPSIRGEEETYYHNLLCIEQQVLAMATKHTGLSDEDVSLAFAVCGVHVLAFLEGSGRPGFTGFAPEVEELANNCLATFHPDFNPELAEVVKDAWHAPDDTELHYRTAGGVLRRLSESCRFWTGQGGRKGYVNYISSFLRESGMMPEGNKINFIIISKTAPRFMERS